MYGEISEMRENNKIIKSVLLNILTELKENYPKDWLLSLEMYELIYEKDHELEQEIHDHLSQLKSISAYCKLVSDGMELIEKK